MFFPIFPDSSIIDSFLRPTPIVIFIRSTLRFLSSIRLHSLSLISMLYFSFSFSPTLFSLSLLLRSMRRRHFRHAG